MFITCVIMWLFDEWCVYHVVSVVSDWVLSDKFIDVLEIFGTFTVCKTRKRE